MDPTDRQDGHDLPAGGAAEGHRAEASGRVRLDRRAEALRANLRRRKAQSRGRAGVDRAVPPD